MWMKISCQSPWIAGRINNPPFDRLSGKESAQGCIPKRVLGRPDEALGGGPGRPGASQDDAGLTRKFEMSHVCQRIQEINGKF